MGIGGGIFLMVVGAILAFGVSDAVEGLDLVVIGWILMGAGVLTIGLALAVNNQRTNTRHTEVVERREEPPPRV